MHVKTEHPPTRKPLSKTDVEKVFAKMIGEGGGDTVENEKAEKTKTKKRSKEELPKYTQAQIEKHKQYWAKYEEKGSLIRS